MGVAELGRSDRERAVEIHHKRSLHGGNRLDGLGLAVLTQNPLEHLKDADHRHYQVASESSTATKRLASGLSVNTSIHSEKSTTTGRALTAGQPLAQRCVPHAESLEGQEGTGSAPALSHPAGRSPGTDDRG
jgi:hypothetical protein